MGLFDFFFELEGPMLWFYGLFFATLVLASLGSTGMGSGASFNAWYLITDAIKAVVGINVVFGIIGFLFHILPLLVIVLLGLGGTRLFNQVIGPISLTETMASLTGGTSLQSVIVFALIVLLLL
jgi:hypothetical protein